MFIITPGGGSVGSGTDKGGPKSQQTWDDEIEMLQHCRFERNSILNPSFMP